MSVIVKNGGGENVTPEVTAQTPVIAQIAENLDVTITTPSGTNKQILQGNNANLQTINEANITPVKFAKEVNVVWELKGLYSQTYALAFDSQGNIYVNGNSQYIRKISCDGEVLKTFSPGYSLNGSSCNMVVDSSDYIYGASEKTLKKFDSNGSTVWSYNLETDVRYIALDSSENICIGCNDGTIKKINPNSELIWSFNTGLSQVLVVCLDSEDNIYCGGCFNSVKKINPNGVLVWSSSTGISFTYGLGVDSDKNIYVSGDKILKKLDSNGSQVWSYNLEIGVESMALDSNGNIYIRLNDSTIKKVKPNGDLIWSFNCLSYPKDIKVDSDNNIYFGDNGGIIAKLKQAPSPILGTFYSKPSSGRPAPMNVYKLETKLEEIVGGQPSEIWQFTGHTGFVYGIAVDSLGNVYSASSDGTVRKIDSNGNQVWSFTTSVGGYAYGIAVDSEGNVCFGTYGSTPTYVFKIDSNRNEIWRISVSSYVYRVTSDLQNNLYVATGSQIIKINSNGTVLWTFTGHTENVYGIAVDKEGNVYSASSDKTVRKIDSNGSQVWSLTATSTGGVDGVAVDSLGNVYSAGRDKTVRKIDSNGKQVWSFLSDNSFIKIEVDLQGNIFCACNGKIVHKIANNMIAQKIAYYEDFPS